MRRRAFPLAAVCILSAVGCNVAWNATMTPTRTGSGVVASEERTIGDFDQIVLQGAMNIEAATGVEPKLTVEADDNLMEIITTEVQGTKLIVSTRENYRSSRGVTVRLTAPAVRSLVLNGSGNISATDVSGPDFEGTINGSGNIAATGSVSDLRATIAGSGNLDLSRLEAKNAAVCIAGSGSVNVHATDTLDATIAGSGDIVYHGQPKVKQTIRGSGSIRPAE